MLFKDGLARFQDIKMIFLLDFLESVQHFKIVGDPQAIPTIIALGNYDITSYIAVWRVDNLEECCYK